jgi:hypothetical protein
MTALENTPFALSYVKEYMLSKLCPYAIEHKIDAIHFKKGVPAQNEWLHGFVYGITAAASVFIIVRKFASFT